MQLTNLIKTISIIGICALVTFSPTARAVTPAPDGGYPGENTAEGDNALLNLVIGTTTGINNTAIGFDALVNNTDGVSNTATGLVALQSNTTGNNNTGTGVDALQGNTTGSFNTATGVEALYSNTTGSNNTAMGGFQTLFSNTSGSNNTGIGSFVLQYNNADNETAVGSQALSSNTTGVDNTATGVQALLSNTTGSNNTATGFQALFSNMGSGSTANGYAALQSNTTGGANAATGAQALQYNTTGSGNTADGPTALNTNTTGSNNTANGYAALYSNIASHYNTASGADALYHSTGNNNIALGEYAGYYLTTGDSNIYIGNPGVAAEAKTIRIGGATPTGFGSQTATFVAGIRGVVITGGQQVAVNASGQLGVKGSSARFKEAIKPMDKASETILALRPVSFRYKKELDPKSEPQFGLIAEEVAKVDPDLVVKDERGKPFSVRYEEVNAMLLNEFLKEHRKVEELQKEIGALASQLQKVSNEIELTKSAPRVVDNQ